MKIKIILISVFLSLFFLPSYAQTPQHRFSINIGGGYMMPFVSPNMMNYGGNYNFNYIKTDYTVVLNNVPEKITNSASIPTQSYYFLYSDINFLYHFNKHYALGLKTIYIPKLWNKQYSETLKIYADVRNDHELYFTRNHDVNLKNSLMGIEPEFQYNFHRISLIFGLGYAYLKTKYTSKLHDTYSFKGDGPASQPNVRWTI